MALLRNSKLCLIALGLLVCAACAESSIFNNIPLTLNPLVLANPISMAANPAALRLYVANSNNQVLWFDASFVILDITNPVNPTPIAVISIPNFSGQTLLDESRGFVYIPNRQSDSNADTVDQVLRININESSPDFLKVDLFDSGNSPFGGFFDGGNNLYVAASQQAMFYNVNDLSSFTLVDLNVTTAEGRSLNGDDTRELMLSPSGNTIFVTNRSDNMLILNTSQFPPPSAPGETDLGQEAVDYIVTGTSSTRGIARDSKFLYIVDGTFPSLKVMTDAGLAPVTGPPQEITSGSLQVASIPVGANPSEVIVDEPNHRAYVSNTDSHDISVIDTNLLTEVTRIPVDENLPLNVQEGFQPFGMALANIGGVNYLYVAEFFTNNITVINADAGTVLSAFPEVTPVPTPPPLGN